MRFLIGCMVFVLLSTSMFAADVQQTQYAISSGDWSGWSKTYAFDGGTAHWWCSVQQNGAINGSAYIGQDFGAGNTQNIRSMSIVQDAGSNGGVYNSLTSALVQYSNDGSEWTSAATWTLPGGSSSTPSTIDLADNGAHRYWRILAGSSAANWCARSVKFSTDGSAHPPSPPSNIPAIVFFGQSLCLNAAGTTSAYAVRHSNLYAMDAQTGAVTPAVDPLPSSAQPGPGYIFIPEIGDIILDKYPAKFPNGLAVVQACLGGTSVFDYQPGGTYAGWIAAVKARLSAAGLTPYLAVWDQGEHDTCCTLPTVKQYRDALANVVAQWGGPFMVDLAAWTNGLPVGTPNVVAAQRSSVDDNTVFLGCDTTQFDNVFRHDQTHQNNLGKWAWTYCHAIPILRFVGSH